MNISKEMEGYINELKKMLNDVLEYHENMFIAEKLSSGQVIKKHNDILVLTGNVTSMVENGH